MVDELLLNLEGFATFLTLVPFQVEVGPLVVLQRQQVVVAFLAHQAAENAGFMRLLVVEERAGVSISSSTLVTLVGFVTLINHRPTPIAAGSSHPFTSRHSFSSI